MTIQNETKSKEQVELEMIQELEKLRQENAKLKAAKPGNSMKITEKGGLSVYGLGRFPVTLYRSQWTQLLAMLPTIEAFIEANKDKLPDNVKSAKSVANVEQNVKVA